ncbi:MAG: dethiobiotin synthase [Actinomycetia bacterium]|nr:dethiobiotin synthase [Actinomycetes bacterium]MCH9709965.1 dethiobiotin synthase [Actinomycetes bacterium]MCH9768231.1 dethiobiotin synthase [Actinomycetes bacterium]
MSVLFVTGTGTGVGKTIATAALACNARWAGVDVAVCKPVQTGIRDGEDDLAEVARLAGTVDLHSLAAFPEPLAPLAAAQRVGSALPARAALLDMVAAVDRPGMLTLVEGAGGLLVEIGDAGVTLRDLAGDLDAPVLTVVAPGLGTLNHTALTLEALAAERVGSAGLVIGAWPAEPGVAEVGNREALALLGPVRATLPAGLGSLTAPEFELITAQAFDRSWVESLVG